MQSFDVQVVGWLIEHEQVAAQLQRQGEVETIALTAGQDAGLLLLIGALEAEGSDIGAARHLKIGDLDVIEPVRHHLPHVLLRIDAAAALIDIGDFDCVANNKFATVGSLLAHDHLEQRCLADTVGANNTHDARARERE